MYNRRKLLLESESHDFTCLRNIVFLRESVPTPDNTYF